MLSKGCEHWMLRCTMLWGPMLKYSKVIQKWMLEHPQEHWMSSLRILKHSLSIPWFTYHGIRILHATGLIFYQLFFRNDQNLVSRSGLCVKLIFSMIHAFQTWTGQLWTLGSLCRFTALSLMDHRLFVVVLKLNILYFKNTWSAIILWTIVVNTYHIAVLYSLTSCHLLHHQVNSSVMLASSSVMLVSSSVMLVSSSVMLVSRYTHNDSYCIRCAYQLQ